MPSVRRKLSHEENVNDSKNTRLNIGLALQQMDLRADYLAHMSRYCKIAELMVNESNRLKRPIEAFEVGCGELWPIRYLYKALQVKKSDVLSRYIGFDIDPNLECQNWYDGLGTYAMDAPGWFKIFNSEVYQQDVTVDPIIDLSDMDMFITTEVIEHMKPEFVEPWIRSAWKAMRKGGLAFISTPNSDGSKDKLPIDHVYEWGYEELKALLMRFFTIEGHYGTFIQLPNFRRAQNVFNGLWPEWLVQEIEGRFDKNWQRVIFAVNYPKFANNVSWILRAK